MGGLFDLDGSLMRALNGFADMIVMSLWWLVGCVPIVTIGASTTALYYAAMKSARRDGTVTKNFWKSYRENLKQAIVVELILVAMAVGLYLLYRVTYGIAAGAGAAMRLLFQALFLLFLILISYVFPVLSRFVTTIPVLFRNAMVMGIAHLPKTIVIVILHLAPLLLLFLRIDWFLVALPLLVALIPGVVASINGPIFAGIFRRYTPQEILDHEDDAVENRGMFEVEE